MEIRAKPVRDGYDILYRIEAEVVLNFYLYLITIYKHPTAGHRPLKIEPLLLESLCDPMFVCFFETDFCC